MVLGQQKGARRLFKIHTQQRLLPIGSFMGILIHHIAQHGNVPVGADSGKSCYKLRQAVLLKTPCRALS
jgi:hypothetical protein